MVTHRVVGQGFDGEGELVLRTQGDANEDPDPQLVKPVQVKGEVWYSVPYLGHVNNLLTGEQRQLAVYAAAARSARLRTAVVRRRGPGPTTHQPREGDSRCLGIVGRRPGPRLQKVRALLGLGVLLGVGATGTFAFWTDDVTIAGTTFTSGTIDLQVKDSDAPSTTTLAMSAMVPGSTSAEVLTVKNNGTAPLKYTMTGGLTGTDAAAYNTATSLKLTIRAGGSVTAAATCTGGTVVYGPTSLTSTVTTSIIDAQRSARRRRHRGTLLPGHASTPPAPSSLQGKTATATFTLTGTSDVS